MEVRSHHWNVQCMQSHIFSNRRPQPLSNAVGFGGFLTGLATGVASCVAVSPAIVVVLYFKLRAQFFTLEYSSSSPSLGFALGRCKSHEAFTTQ